VIKRNAIEHFKGGGAVRLLATVCVALLTLASAGTATDLGGTADLMLHPIAGGLDTVVDITHAGDDRLFLSLQDGQVLIYDGAPPPLATFLDISGLVGSGFEGGIKSVAFHPDHAENGFFFIHYSDVAGDSVVARYEVSGDPDIADPSSAEILLTVDQDTELHRGGQLQFGPDGYLYIGLGDGGPQTDTECHAQSPDTFQGKLLRIDVDQNVGTPPFYGIPGDNPFGGVGEPAAEVWALGLRQPWRFSFDRATGDLYVADVGQFSREEVDFQPAGSSGGQNYGWRIMEGTECHDPDPIDPDCPVGTPSCGDPAFTAPIFDYGRENGECSITGGYVYRGSQIPALVGRYLYGDWCSGRIWAADNSSGPWTSELLPISVPGVTTFGEDVAGNLYVTNGSTVWRITSPSEIFSDGFESGDTSAW
jgi:glucose/arabinose dehydrogenase